MSGKSLIKDSRTRKNFQALSNSFLYYSKFLADSSIQSSNDSNEPRIMFISLVYFQQFLEMVPFQILYHSILCFGIRKSDIFGNDDGDANTDNTVDSSAAVDTTHRYRQSFLSKFQIKPLVKHLIKLKDSQGLVIWAAEDASFNDVSTSNDEKHLRLSVNLSNSVVESSPSISSVAHALPFNASVPSALNLDGDIPLVIPSVSNEDVGTPVCQDWVSISQQLTQIINPVTGLCYSPLKLDLAFWKEHDPQHITTVKRELESLDYKYKSVKLLIEKSNPSLRTMVIFDSKEWFYFSSNCIGRNTDHPNGARHRGSIVNSDASKTNASNSKRRQTGCDMRRTYRRNKHKVTTSNQYNPEITTFTDDSIDNQPEMTTFDEDKWFYFK